MSKTKILVRFLSLALLTSCPLLAKADERGDDVRRDDVHREAPRVRRHHRVVRRVVEERRPDIDNDHHEVHEEHHDDPR